MNSHWIVDQLLIAATWILSVLRGGAETYLAGNYQQMVWEAALILAATLVVVGAAAGVVTAGVRLVVKAVRS